MPSPHAPNSHPPRTPHPTRDFCIHYWAGSISTSFHSPEKLRQESDTFPSWLPYFLSHTAAAAKSLQSCPTLCDPMDCSLPGSSVPGIFQAGVLEWGASAFSVYYTGLPIKTDSNKNNQYIHEQVDSIFQYLGMYKFLNIVKNCFQFFLKLFSYMLNLSVTKNWSHTFKLEKN